VCPACLPRVAAEWELDPQVSDGSAAGDAGLREALRVDPRAVAAILDAVTDRAVARARAHLEQYARAKLGAPEAPAAPGSAAPEA
jgi:hypothetical protein